MCCVLFLLVVLAGPFSPGYAAVSEISLDEAKRMARQNGPDLTMLQLEYETVKEQLAETRSELGIGVYDSRAMKEDIQSLEEAVEEWEDRIAEQEVIIAGLEEKKEDLAEDDERFKEIKEELEEESLQLRKLQEDLTELRKGRANLLVRYRSTKVFEDRFSNQLDPLEKAITSLEDALQVQPQMLDYLVEELYFSQLLLKTRESMLNEVLSYQERLLEIEELKMELGLATPVEIVEAESIIKESKGDILALQAEKESLAHSFQKLLGIPLMTSFELYEEKPSIPDVKRLLALPAPDLKGSVEYRRAWEDLLDAQEELEDTSQRDARKYRLAELEVKEAEMELENILKELEINYENRREALKVAGERYANAENALSLAEHEYALSGAKYVAGVFSGLALEGEKLKVLEKALSYKQAGVNYYLQEQAYGLARRGIEIEVRSPVS